MRVGVCWGGLTRRRPALAGALINAPGVTCVGRRCCAGCSRVRDVEIIKGDPG